MSLTPPLILRAAWVAPMGRAAEAALHADGAVAFAAGRVLDAGPARDVLARCPGAEVLDLGDSLLLPGLVNAHAHLELSLSAGPAPRPARWGGTFADWLLDLIGRAPAPADLPSATAAAVAEGVGQCLRFGVSSVGDITAGPGLTRPLLGGGPPRVTSYGEVIALGQRRGRLGARLAAALDATAASPTLRVGLSPHAPYTVEPEGYARCLRAAREADLPLATHLAETADEAPFLSGHAGPFRALWEALGAWDEQVPAFVGGPIRLAHSLGLLHGPTLLAHVNYCDDDELALLASGRASVIYCPRTHAYFGHPPHRWRQMRAHGVNVAVGTDSAASAPDLNLVDDLRLLHRLAPEVPAGTLWRMATADAARAIRSGAGVLAPGRPADAVAFPARTDRPLEEVLEHSILPSRLWIAGEEISPRPARPDGA